MTTTARIQKLREALANHNIEGLITSRRENVSYFTHLNMEAILLITSSRCFAIAPLMYEEEAELLDASWELITAKRTLIEEAGQIMDQLPITVWGYEPEHLSHAAWEKLQKSSNSTLKPVSAIVDSLRARKDPQELNLLQKARSISVSALGHIEHSLHEGISEVDVALEIITYFMKHANGSSFDPIVLFGERTSLPHGTPSRRVLKRSDEIILIDLGATVEGYHGDITRTIIRDSAGNRWRDVYEYIQYLQQVAIRMLRPGISCREVDAAIREDAAAKGFAANIRHSLGHGIGLAVHEYPTMGKHSTAVLQEHMVVTVEPGLYFPGRGGVRIEDMVEITEQGGQTIS